MKKDCEGMLPFLPVGNDDRKGPWHVCAKQQNHISTNCAKISKTNLFRILMKEDPSRNDYEPVCPEEQKAKTDN